MWSSAPLPAWCASQSCGGVPALRVNLLPGLYRVFARAPGRNDSPAADSVRVRAGEVTSTRVDF
jgi:hypothetical protein